MTPVGHAVPYNEPLIPIQRSASLHLVCLGHGDDRRFARLFREVWLRIPSGCRRRMIDWWRGHDRVHDPQRSRIAAGAHGVRRIAHDRSFTVVTPRVELAWGWRDRVIILPPPQRKPKTPVEPRGHADRAFGMMGGWGHH